MSSTQSSSILDLKKVLEDVFLVLSAKEKEELQMKVFKKLSYDEKLTYCLRPEEVEVRSEMWLDINKHLKTNANNISELI